MHARALLPDITVLTLGAGGFGEDADGLGVVHGVRALRTIGLRRASCDPDEMP